MSRYRPDTQISSLIIHCAATPNGRPHTAADIDRWHGERTPPFTRHPDALTGTGAWAGKGQHARDLAHIGYHYVIRINGVVEVGRRLTETGAHCVGHNATAIGVCMIGTDAFTQAQWDALAKLVKATARDRKQARLPTLTLHGHREFAAHKACPGFDVAAWVANGYTPAPANVLEAK